MTKIYSNQKILIVDDNYVCREILSRRLEKLGYKTFCAIGGEQAIEMVAQQQETDPFDLIVLDVLMPSPTGLEVLQQLRLEFSKSQLPIIMASGIADATSIVEALHLGANDYMTKPIVFDIAHARIRNQLEFKNTYERLETAEQSAIQIGQTKQDFLANMSHEIRTPLNAIIGAASLMNQTDLNPEQADYAKTITNGSDALLMLINDILDFSKIEAGKIEMENLTFDVRTMIEQTMDLFNEAASQKNIDFTYILNDNVEHDLKGDPGRIRQIISNFISNAIKFTDQGEVSVAVAVTKQDKDKEKGALLKISVSDNGIGISKEQKEKLFTPFTQADMSTTRLFGGTGLGLSITKDLAEIMHGSITLDSELGKGSTFTLEAPLNIGYDTQDSQNTKGASPLPGVKLKFDSCKILIVDKSTTSSESLRAMLEPWSVDVETATSMTQANENISHFGIESFSQIYIDQTLADGTGQSYAQQLENSHGENCPSLILTVKSGRKSRGLAKNLRSSVFDNFLSKYYSHDSVLRIMGQNSGVDIDRYLQTPKQFQLSRRKGDNIDAKKWRILVVDDNPANQKVTTKMIQKCGYSADVVGDGKEAVSAVTFRKYDLVLMDCQMPIMDGYTATREIRKLEKDDGTHQIIIAMTASALKGNRDECKAAGMDGYISKPVKLDVLSQNLEKWFSIIENKNKTKNSEVSSIDTDLTKGAVDLSYIQYLKDLSDDEDPTFYEDQVVLFRDRAILSIDEMQNALHANNFEALEQSAHALAGSAGLVGAKSLNLKCSHIENEAHAKNLESVPATLKEVEEEYQLVMSLLMAEIEEAA